MSWDGHLIRCTSGFGELVNAAGPHNSLNSRRAGSQAGQVVHLVSLLVLHVVGGSWSIPALQSLACGTYQG